MMLEDKPEDIIDIANEILEEAKRYDVNVPLGVAFDIGNVVVLIPSGDDLWEDSDKQILRNLDNVVPKELIQEGREGFQGDLGKEVIIPLNFKEVRAIGQAALAQPSGKQIIDSFTNVQEIDKFDYFRIRGLNAFLQLQREFVKSGGKLDKELSNRVEEELS